MEVDSAGDRCVFVCVCKCLWLEVLISLTEMNGSMTTQDRSRGVGGGEWSRLAYLTRGLVPHIYTPQYLSHVKRLDL